jgi:hypothetical protein
MSQVSTNHIKIGSSTINSLTVGDFSVGVKGGADYGPTSNTGFYNGITPPVGGYTIYVSKMSDGPSIHVPRTDEECLYYLNKYGANASNITDALTWANGQTNLLVRTSEYLLSDLPGGYSFTLNSSDIQVGYGNYNSWNGHNYPVALGTNGVDGFSLTFYAGQPSDLSKAAWVPYQFNIGSQTIVDFFNNLVSSNVLPYAWETTLWNVQWGPGSTHASGVVSLSGTNTVGYTIYMAPLDTTDPTWNQSGNSTLALEGTYNFPATFTLIEPAFNKGGWC